MFSLIRNFTSLRAVKLGCIQEKSKQVLVFPFICTNFVPMKKLMALLLLFVLASWMPIHAQNGMIVQHYTLEEGLPSNTVYCSLKDKDGFVWFGTWYGLCSFDGSKFTPFVTRSRQESDIPPRKVISMVEDGDDNIWIRNVDNRLYLYDKHNDIYHEIYDELKKISQNVQVIKIQRASNGHVLILTRNKNLYEAYPQPLPKGGENGGGGSSPTIQRIFDGSLAIDPATFRLQHNIFGVSENYLYWLGTDFKLDVVPRPKGNQYLSLIKPDKLYSFYYHIGNQIYIGNQQGETYIIDADKGTVQNYSSPDIPILTDAKNQQWFINHNEQSLVCQNPLTGFRQHFPIPQGEKIATRKCCDAGQNGLFFLHENGIVWRYDQQTGIMQDIADFRQFSSTSANALRFFDMDIDSEGLLWLSSTTNGVYKVNFTPFSFSFFMSEMLSQENEIGDSQGIRAIFQQKNGNLWIGTRNGTLYCINPMTQAIVPTAVNGIGNVYHVMEDSRGQLWFCTKGNGLFRLNSGNGELTHFESNPADRYSLNDNRVYYIFEDSRHHIWVCTFGGGLNLIQQRGGRTAFINRNNEFADYPKYDLYLNARAITEDSTGRLWVGTTDGLMSFAGSFSKPQDIHFEIYREQQDAGTVDNDVFSLYKDSKGHIWMGMFGGGLNLLEGYDEKTHRPQLKNYPFTEQLSGNVVSSIIEDHQHHLWLCTENGLASLNPEEETTLRSYDRFSGFPIVNVEDNTIACLADGRIFIGCQQGVLAFDPKVVMNETVRQYPIYIVDFRVQNRQLNDFQPPIYEGSVRYAKEIVLKHDQSMFSIEFASLNYTDQNQVSYSYILDGYEDRWHTNGLNRIASYANVPPGRYTFRVKTLGSGDSERVLEIRILPPWWASWWAYIIYTLLFLALLYGAFRLVMYMIRMRNETYVNDRLAELKIRFFTNISHELRTPLTLIKSPIEELKRNERLSPAGKEYLSLIDNNAKKMLQLVNQILDFRKVQNGKMKMHVSYTDLNEVLEMFRQEYRIHAQERDINYEFLLPDEHVMAWCDRQKISVVVNNLINNAFKYTREGGTITVSMEAHPQPLPKGGEYGASPSGRFGGALGWATIRVEDDGASIPENKLEEIFERFAMAENRSDDTTSTGTGIGLSLSREFVLMHHGHIWAENLDKGVAFVIELPTEKENFSADEIEEYVGAHPLTPSQKDGESDTTQTGENNPSPRERPRVGEHCSGMGQRVGSLLLIEDNIDLCHMLSLQLQNKYTVLTAHDGEEGLKKIYQYHPDLIVSDLMMPKIDGLELLKRIRQDFNISHIPVIILTAKQGDEIHTQAISTGANAYIAKPFSSQLLEARIGQLLEEQRIFQRKMVLAPTTTKSIPLGEVGGASQYESHLIQKDLEFVRNVHQIIEKNLQNEDFNVNTLAEEMGLSRSPFFKKLKSLTGFAPVDLVKEIRLTKALNYVETTDMNVTEIAYTVGFRDPGYFTKCFRQKYGKTPKEYRNDLNHPKP